MAALLLNRYTIGAAILIAALLGSYWRGHHAGYDTGNAAGQIAGYKVGHDDEEKVYKAHLDADAAAEKAAELAAATAQFQMSQSAQAASDAYDQGVKNANANAQKTVADLRAGTISLQHRWSGCEASRVSTAAAAAAELDAIAADRQESAGRIIAAADACDAQVAGLQSVLIGERAAQVKP